MTLQDVARQAGVSRSTVSRVVNNDPRVSDAVRQRVQQTIEEIGYRPHAAARALASQRPEVVGLIVPEDFARIHVDHWYPMIIEATLSAARRCGLALMLIMEDTFAKGAGERVTQQFYDSARVEGFLILQHSYSDELTPALRRRHVPHVLLGESTLAGSGWVDIDNRAWGERAAHHLLSHGVRRPAAIVGSIEHVPSRLRVEGFREAFGAEGIRVAVDSIAEVGFSPSAARERALDLLENPDAPDGVLAVNGWLSAPVTAAASLCGRRIPQDFKLLAFDDFDSESNALNGTTAIVQPVRPVADGAMELLADMIEGRRPASASVAIPTHLVPRGSCAEPTATLNVPTQAIEWKGEVLAPAG